MKPKDQKNFICGPLFFKWMGVFQSSLDFFSIGVFIQNINFLSSAVLVFVVHLLQFLKAVICSLITRFFKCIKLHQILSQFSAINPAGVLDINTFGRDHSNLKNPIPSKDVNLQYICTVYIREQGQYLMQQKRRTHLALHFFKKHPTQDFFQFSVKRILCPKVYIFNKVRTPDEVVTQN